MITTLTITPSFLATAYVFADDYGFKIKVPDAAKPEYDRVIKANSNAAFGYQLEVPDGKKETLPDFMKEVNATFQEHLQRLAKYYHPKPKSVEPAVINEFIMRAVHDKN